MLCNGLNELLGCLLHAQAKRGFVGFGHLQGAKLAVEQAGRHVQVLACRQPRRNHFAAAVQVNEQRIGITCAQPVAVGPLERRATDDQALPRRAPEAR